MKPMIEQLKDKKSLGTCRICEYGKCDRGCPGGSFSMRANLVTFSKGFVLSLKRIGLLKPDRATLEYFHYYTMDMLSKGKI